MGGKIIIYCNQLNVSGYVSCSACGFVERCSECGQILRLTIENSVHTLKCPQCNLNQKARDVCQKCLGITLLPKKQGIEAYYSLIIDILEKNTVPIYQIHSATKNTSKLLSTWNTKGGILIISSHIFQYNNLFADIIYLAPNSWTTIGQYPEEMYYQYAWLLHHTKRIISLPFTHQLLSYPMKSNLIKLSNKAKDEYLSAKKYSVTLPCILL